MTTVPSGVKNQTGIFKWPIKTLQPPLKNYLFLDQCLQTHRWQTNCFLYSPTKPFKSLHFCSPGRGEMSVLSGMSFHLQMRTFFFPLQSPNRIDWKWFPNLYLSGLEPRLKTEIPLENQVFSIALKEFAIKLFKAQAVGEALARKKPCH